MARDINAISNIRSIFSYSFIDCFPFSTILLFSVGHFRNLNIYSIVSKVRNALFSKAKRKTSQAQIVFSSLGPSAKAFNRIDLNTLHFKDLYSGIFLQVFVE